MVILSKFAETLSALMSERNLNAPALGKIIKTDRSNITRYQKGERLPSFEVFVALIEYFNVSADRGQVLFPNNLRKKLTLFVIFHKTERTVS